MLIATIRRLQVQLQLQLQPPHRLLLQPRLQVQLQHLHPLRQLQLLIPQHQHLQLLHVAIVVWSCWDTWKIGAQPSSGGMRTCLDIA